MDLIQLGFQLIQRVSQSLQLTPLKGGVHLIDSQGGEQLPQILGVAHGIASTLMEVSTGS